MPQDPVMVPLSIEQQVVYERLNAAIRGHQGWLTRYNTRVNSNIALMAQSGSEDIIAAMMVDMRKMEDQMDSVEALLQKKISMKPEKVEDCNFLAETMGKLHKETNDAMRIASARYHRKMRIDNTNPAPTTGAQTVSKLQLGLKPEPLTKEHTPAEFRLWKRAFEAFYAASRLDRAGIEEQRAYLTQCLDKDMAMRISDKVAMGTALYGNNGVIHAVEKQFLSLYPLFSRRQKYFAYKQESGQAATDYMIKLKRLGDEADLSDMTVDMQHMMKYVCGINDEKLRSLLLALKTPTLAEMEDEFERYESSRAGIAALNKPGAAGGAAKKVATAKPKADKPRTGGNGNQDGAKKCTVCGRTGHPADQCRMKDCTCYSCGTVGHTRAACRASEEKKQKYRDSKPAAEGAARQLKDEPAQEELEQAGHSRMMRSLDVSASHEGHKPTPLRSLKFKTMQGFRFIFAICPDTGTTMSIMSENILIERGIKYIKQEMTPMFAANGQKMNITGKVRLTVKRDDASEVAILIAVCTDMINEILISWHDCITLRLGVLPTFPYGETKQATVVKKHTWTAHSVAEMVKDKFKSVLSNTLGLKPMNGDPMKVHLMKTKNGEEVIPKQVYTARQIPLHQREMADKLTDELINSKIIVAVKEPTPWVSPAFFVPKGDGRMRLVTDYTYINEFISRPTHPFPSAKEIMRRVKPDSKAFMAIDCIHGYYQMALEEASSYLTTFLLPRGRFRYMRGPMGLNPTNDEWCRRSDVLIEGLD